MEANFIELPAARKSVGCAQSGRARRERKAKKKVIRFDFFSPLFLVFARLLVRRERALFPTLANFGRRRRTPTVRIGAAK